MRPALCFVAHINNTTLQNPVTGTQRNKIPRMPRRDIHMRIFGQTALDISWHFIQRWNYTRYVSHSQKLYRPLVPSGAGAMEMLKMDHPFLQDKQMDQ